MDINKTLRIVTDRESTCRHSRFGESQRRLILQNQEKVKVLKPSLFICYNHLDKKWLKRFLVMMAPIVRNQIIEIWWDGQIKPGKQWREEIEQALKKSTLGLMLVSPNFLNSKFILETELPYLLAAAKRKKVVLTWAYLKPCLYRLTPLKDLQAIHDVNKPLHGLRPAECDQTIMNICYELAHVAGWEKE